MPKSQILQYNPKLKEVAKKLRSKMTLSEVLLWEKLRNKALVYDFDRQRPIGNYIVDFYCKDLKLAIEIDGNSHDNLETYNADINRQNEIEKLGIRFLRFNDLEVKKNMGQVLFVIQNWIEQNRKEPTPAPPMEGI